MVRRTKGCIREKSYLLLPPIITVMLFSGLHPGWAETNEEWSRSLSVGLNMIQGNSDSSLFTLNLLAEKEHDGVKAWRLGADASYGKTKKEVTTNNAKGFLESKGRFSTRGFWGLITSLARDDIAEIDYRLIVGPVIGYYFIKGSQTKLSAEAGPSYTYEKFRDGEEKRSPRLRIAERFEQHLSKTAEWWQSAEYLPDLENKDRDNFLINAELGTKADLNAYLSLKIVNKYTYDHEPAGQAKKYDFSLQTFLTCKF